VAIKRTKNIAYNWEDTITGAERCILLWRVYIPGASRLQLLQEALLWNIRRRWRLMSMMLVAVLMRLLLLLLLVVVVVCHSCIVWRSWTWLSTANIHQHAASTHARHHDNHHHHHHHHRTSEASVYLARAVMTGEPSHDNWKSTPFIWLTLTTPIHGPCQPSCAVSLLPSTPTVAIIYYYYSSRKLILNSRYLVEIRKCGFLVSLSTMVRS